MTVGEMAAVLRDRGLLRAVYRDSHAGTETAENASLQAGGKAAGNAGLQAGGKAAENEGLQTGGKAAGNTDVCGHEIKWLTCDSRTVVAGTLFICKGAAFRPEYLQQAVDEGCIAYISEQKIKVGGAPAVLLVTDIRKAMAVAAAAFFGYEPGKPILTGITGTKGKTTTSWYLKAMLDEWQKEKGGRETGLISTVENYDGKKREDAVMTTPEATVLHEMLANARENQVPYLTMEVSSQALKYRRVKELCFQVGIFLNISEDHISPAEHEDFEDYFSAKLSIFRQTETACINLDSDCQKQIQIAAQRAKRVITFGRDPGADIRYSAVRTEQGRISFRVTCDRFSQRFTLGMKGRFNIENAMAAIAAAYVYGVPVSCMKRGLERTKVPGRMETFYSRDRRICGVVDFAHNRLSFEKLFDAACREYGEYGKIITVFGCPGGKALNRRRELGILAGRFSDFVCITSDDPGMECQEDIAAQVQSYVEMTGCPCKSIADRKEAICYAARLAEKSGEKTLILALGRGCEKFQRIGGGSYAYPTDSQMMEEILMQSRTSGEKIL